MDGGVVESDERGGGHGVGGGDRFEGGILVEVGVGRCFGLLDEQRWKYVFCLLKERESVRGGELTK